MIENEKPPTQILVNRDQRFGMFLVAVLRHEQWTTSGDFHLRFVRRVPVLDKPCAAPMGGPSTGSASLLSNPSSSSTEEPESSGAESAKDEREEQKGVDQKTSTSTNSDNHENLTDEEKTKNGYNHTTGTSTNSDIDEDLTEEEDYHSIGAAALRGVGGGLIPPGMFPPTQ